MTITEDRPLPALDTGMLGLERMCCDARSVLDTTELRWFASGPVPTAVGTWFTGSSGVLEERCDHYLVDGPVGGRADVGVKRRFGDTLEVKIRRSLDGQMEIGGGLAGSLEAWQKWCPADRLDDEASAGRWVDVRKRIVKRRFSMNGSEVASTFGTPVTGVGCDVEIAEVTVGARQWWTFAFAAFGPLATRRDALSASWQGLLAASGRPDTSGPFADRAMGYPEWLAFAAPQMQPSRPLAIAR